MALANTTMIKIEQLKVLPGVEVQAGVVEYPVFEPNYSDPVDAFTVQFFPSETHRDGGRGYCDWCETPSGSRASANCIHVRAVKKSIKNEKV